MAIAGSLDSELGCAADWDPACDQAQLTLDPATLVWKLAVANLPAGTYAVQSRAEPQLDT